MPFKIIQTMERGRLRLTSVPDQWENNGTLFWPKTKQEKLRRQENCNPESNWTAINCIVKRRNLRTFKDAESEIDAMCDRSDTETDNERFRTKRLSPTIHRGPLAESFNLMAQELVENNDQETSAAAIPQQETITPDESYVAALNIVQNQEPKPNSFPEEINLDTNTLDNQILILNQDIQIQQIQADVQTIKQDVKIILQNQSALFELQNKLILKHSEIQTQFEEFIRLSSKPSIQRQDDAIKIIKSLKDFETFEKDLSDAILKEEYRKKMRGLCNRGSGKGTTNAYYLIDHLFDREFLKGCSWTGSSKESDTVKVCFKAFQKTINFFFDVVKESDETFTKVDCEKFFKIVLKNARQRCDSNKRTSASRQRIKSNKIKKTTEATSSVSAITAEQPGPSNRATSSVPVITAEQPGPSNRATSSVPAITAEQPGPSNRATSSVLAITAEQPGPSNHALPAPESSPEQYERGVANAEVINLSRDLLRLS